MDNDLLLLSGNDIPFIQAQTIVHQPRLKEIALIGEETFFTGCQMLTFSKDMLTEEDKSHLEGRTNFDILIAILNERNAVMQKNRNCVEMVLALLFPDYSITLTSTGIELKKEDSLISINNTNFEEFKDIIKQMLFLDEKSEKQDFNPSGKLAQSIADKLKKRHQKLAELKPESKVSIINRYVSILAVGEHKDMNELFNYTLYQLFDEFKRYQLKMGYDIYIQAKMAGAQDLKEVDDWMADIHS